MSVLGLAAGGYKKKRSCLKLLSLKAHEPSHNVYEGAVIQLKANLCKRNPYRDK